jgi:hypothetical protein
MTGNQINNRRWEQLAILLICVAVIASAYMLTFSQSGGLVFRNVWTGTETCIPEVCAVRKTFGISCPGCGLIRSFTAAAKMELHNAFHYNPVGPFLLVICVLQIPYRIMRYHELGSSLVLWNRVADRLHVVTWIVLCSLLLNWLATTAGPQIRCAFSI